MTTQPPDLKKLREVVSEMYESHRPSDSTVGRWASLIEEAADAYEASARDAERLDWIEREACTVQAATAGEDDLHYEVVSYHMAFPFTRLIGYGATPREAIDAARHATQGD